MNDLIPANAPAQRPTLALRIGITGARRLHASEIPRLTEQTAAALIIIRVALQRLADDPANATAYCHTLGVAPSLRFLSPLARGADRLAAGIALDQHYQLHVPMPFPKPIYTEDFTGSDRPYEPQLSAAEDRAAFEALFAQGTHIALDGGRNPSEEGGPQRQGDENRSYEAVGHYVVRNSDILLAIWGGKPADGVGGTGDIVRYAARQGVPVWWINATENQPPRWIEDDLDLNAPVEKLASPVDALPKYLAAALHPPPPIGHHPHNFLENLAHMGRTQAETPWQDYFTEQPRAEHRFWHAHSVVMKWARTRRMVQRLDLPWSPLPALHTEPAIPPTTATAFWQAHYAPADARSNEYTARYRSSYIWVAIFAVAAVLFGALAELLSIFHAPAILGFTAILLEVAALIGVLAISMAATRYQWHERGLEYRMFAELCRKQELLAPFGRALSIGAARNATPDARARWVGWLFAAHLRAGPFAQAPAAVADLLPGVASLAIDQIEYQRNRAINSAQARQTFVLLGLYSFLAVFVFIALKLLIGPWYHDLALIPGLIASILPGVAAAFVLVRAYAELELLVEQSRHTEAALMAACARIARLEPSHALAAYDLGQEAASLATIMLQDLEGWARLFRVKGVEAG